MLRFLLDAPGDGLGVCLAGKLPCFWSAWALPRAGSWGADLGCDPRIYCPVVPELHGNEWLRTPCRIVGCKSGVANHGDMNPSVSAEARNGCVSFAN